MGIERYMFGTGCIVYIVFEGLCMSLVLTSKPVFLHPRIQCTELAECYRSQKARFYNACISSLQVTIMENNEAERYTTLNDNNKFTQRQQNCIRTTINKTINNDYK